MTLIKKDPTSMDIALLAASAGLLFYGSWEQKKHPCEPQNNTPAAYAVIGGMFLSIYAIYRVSPASGTVYGTSLIAGGIVNKHRQEEGLEPYPWGIEFTWNKKPSRMGA